MLNSATGAGYTFDTGAVIRVHSSGTLAVNAGFDPINPGPASVTIESSGTLIISSGATVAGGFVTVQNGGAIVDVVQSGSATNFIISQGTHLNVSNGGVAISATVGTVGFEVVSAGGLNSSGTVSNGGFADSGRRGRCRQRHKGYVERL